MIRMCCRSLAAAAALAVLPGIAGAQGTNVTGRVTSDAGAALAGATVVIEAMGIGALTRDDGRYTLVIPEGRAAGQQVTVTARLIGYKPRSAQIALTGQALTQDFELALNPLQLGEVVVTGAGTATTAEKLGNVRNNVDAVEIQKSNESNLVAALAAKAPNVEITSSGGEPGSSAYIRIRGTRSLSGSGQPLFIVDGVPVTNSSFSTSSFNPLDEPAPEISGTTQMNRAVDIDPDDIENVEILKGAAAAAIYGARAGQGVILITTKRGRPGPTKYSLRTSLSVDDVNNTYPLQTRWGVGSDGVSALPCESPANGPCRRAWGPDLIAAGLPRYDHANEAYVNGHTTENTLTVSGGNERTTFYLSGGYTDQRGVFAGPNNSFTRTTVRLNATHFATNTLKLGGNISYADTRGEFILRGNNVNGLQLALLRTPPDFNNLPYLDPVNGLHRSYRFQNPGPGDAVADRGFDNPFFVLYENQNTSRVGRIFGNLSAEYTPLTWLKVNYILGADYSNDERLEGAPQASSDVSSGGRVTEGKIVDYQIDHNLTATASYRLNANLAGTLTVGQNLNSRDTRILAVVGRTLVAPSPFRLSNTVSRDPPIDSTATIHTESYFGQATWDLLDQLYLTAAARYDGFSTFGRNNQYAWYPKASVAWEFTKLTGEQPWLSFGKVRFAYGQTGQEPDPYLTQTTYSGAVLGGIAQGTGLTPTQSGFGGLATNFVKGTENLKPERNTEFETGFDLGLFRERADVSFTYYNQTTNDLILLTPVPPSTGFTRQVQNSGKVRNRGVELGINVRPIQRPDFGWDVGVQWAQNKSKVLHLGGAEFVILDNNRGIVQEVFKPGDPVGVIYDFGFVRCGISPANTVDDQEEACAGRPNGTLYIAENGFPVADPTQRVIGDPNPKWTGSVRTGLRFKKAQLSALVDIRHGGDIYNGTKGALWSYGTHKDTEVRATCVADADDEIVCTGNEKVFGQNGWFDGPVTGPGAGTTVPIGQNWYRDGDGPCPFSGISEQCIEDGGYVKLREISLAYTFDTRWVQRLGLSSIDVRVAGRNLKTWTDYTGYDPETNSGGAIQRTRGADYFNMPQTRSFVFTLSLNR